ncbi:hypothetical protein NCG97_11025 [Streptomyces lydicamycinicus]|uniref:hypothetical protein n=1 Tax=Streptomyces lydicamycinicus TaxID=1546107 RepID=UPI000A402912|nr:hypothetical protein [Streptomyces lydicamycinicus]USA01104.1 hypothetical protein NCG97_11025 [Streptomyces lydicamycinicus]
MLCTSSPTGPAPLRASSGPLLERDPSSSPCPLVERPRRTSPPPLAALAPRAAFRSLAERVLDGVSVTGAFFPACRPACMAFMRYHLRHRL